MINKKWVLFSISVLILTLFCGCTFSMNPSMTCKVTDISGQTTLSSKSIPDTNYTIYSVDFINKGYQVKINITSNIGHLDLYYFFNEKKNQTGKNITDMIHFHIPWGVQPVDAIEFSYEYSYPTDSHGNAFYTDETSKLNSAKSILIEKVKEICSILQINLNSTKFDLKTNRCDAP